MGNRAENRFEPLACPREGHRRDSQVVPHGQLMENVVFLWDVADAATGNVLGGLPRYVRAFEKNFACRRAQAACDRLHQSALACAIWAEHDDDFAGGDFEIHTVQDGDAAVARNEPVYFKLHRRLRGMRK